MHLLSLEQYLLQNIMHCLSTYLAFLGVSVAVNFIRLLAQVDVNGENTHPVYSFLKQHLPTESGGSGLGSQDLSIQWNFEKFLVDRHGYPQKLVASEFDEQSLEADLLPLLTSRT